MHFIQFFFPSLFIASFSLPLYLSISCTVMSPSPTHSPTHLSLPVPRLPFSVCRHALMSPIRKGNEASYRCKYLGPLAAPWLITRRQEQGRLEGGEEEREQRLDRETVPYNAYTAYWRPIERQGGCNNGQAGFITMQEASSGTSEQQRAQNRERCALFLCFTTHPFLFLSRGCPIIQPAVLFQHFWGVFLSLPPPPALSISSSLFVLLLLL